MFEKDDRLGGLLRYGIPDFKLEKHILDRRLEQMVAEGVKFETERQCRRRRLGRRSARDVSTPSACAWGPASRGNFACPAPTWAASTSPWSSSPSRTAASPATRRCRQPTCILTPKDKHVIVVGGGDTGSDCVGTAIRQEARIRHAIGNPAPAARRLQCRNPLAVLAEDHANLLLAGGRLPAPLEHADQGAQRQGRPR